MNKEVFDLWTHVTGECMRMPTITAYTPAEKKSDGAVVILPGGGYGGHSPSEGEAYAKFLQKQLVSDLATIILHIVRFAKTGEVETDETTGDLIRRW